MKKMKLIKSRKMLTVMLTATAAMAVTPMTGYADVNVAVQADETGSGEETAKVLCGNDAGKVQGAVSWKLTKNAEGKYTLTISGEGEMNDWSGNITTTGTQPWKKANTGIDPADISEIVIEEGITRIGNFAFDGTVGVSVIKIPASLKEIGRWGICVSGLENIELADGNNSFKLREGVLFNEDETVLIAYPGGREAIAQYVIPSTVKELASGSFSDCDVQKLVIPENVTKIPAWSLSGTTQEVDLQATLETIPANMFSSFKNLKKATIGTGVKTIGERMFYQCTALESVSLPETITQIANGAFWGCTALKTINLPENVKSIGTQAFLGCKELKEVVLPDSLEEIDGSIFSGCSGLERITFGSGIRKIASQYLQGESIKSIDIHKAVNVAEKWNNGADSSYKDRSLNNVCAGFSSARGASVYGRSYEQISSIRGNVGWGSGGSGTGNTSNYYFVVPEKDAVLEYNSDFATPVRSGYKFTGWYEMTGTNTVSETATEETAFTPHKIYMAKWETSEGCYSVNQKKLDFNIVAYNDNVESKEIVATSSNAAKKAKIVSASCSDAVFSVEITGDEDTVKVTPDSTASVGKHTANIYIVMEDGTKFIVPVSIEIKKAKWEYDIPEDLEATEGKTLEEVELPEGFTWQDPLTTVVGKAGKHTFKVTYVPEDTDHYEIEVNIKITIIVSANTKPVINASDKVLTVGDNFNPLGNVTASDEEDGDLTDQIEIEHNVNTAKAGTYWVTYSVTDRFGATTTKTVTVTVNPKMEALNAVPTITAENVTLTVGDTFDAKKNVTASDKEDGDLTAKIEITANDVDTTKAGTYHVMYKVTDSQGASATKTITVTVKAKANTNSSDSDDGGEPASSTTRKTSLASASTLEGFWKRNEKGWWFEAKDGSYPKSSWKLIGWNGKQQWYHFDENGYMQTGWIKDNGIWYYLHNQADGSQGHMYTGWHLIDGKWYYFSEGMKQPQGAMLANTTTPDGYEVGPDGAWTGK